MATCLVSSKVGTTQNVAVFQEGASNCLYYAVDSQTWAKISEVISPTLSLDYVQLAAVWAFFCTFTVSLFLFSRGCNQVLKAVERS